MDAAEESETSRLAALRGGSRLKVYRLRSFLWRSGGQATQGEGGDLRAQGFQKPLIKE